MNDCIFCKIIAGDIPSKKVLETENLLCIEDIAPKAPVHILVIPKRHIPNVLAFTAQDGQLLAEMMQAVQTITAEKGIDKNGFRLVFNTGKDACQTVDHVHMHIIGGTQLTENMA